MTTKDSEARAVLPLDRAAIGASVVIEALEARGAASSVVDADLSEALRAEGIVPGVELTPERRLPPGSPVIVRIGRTRVALGRDIARRLLVRDPSRADAPEEGR